MEITSRTPLFSIARKLIGAGLADEDTELEMIWAGSISVAMRGRAGMLAKLTVREDEKESPRIALWKPHSFRAVSPRNRFSGEPATPIAETVLPALLHGTAVCDALGIGSIGRSD